jgi:hypothetical protein
MERLKTKKYVENFKAGLVEFLVERRLITLKTDQSYMEVLSFSKNKGYIQFNCYAMLNFYFQNRFVNEVSKCYVP